MPFQRRFAIVPGSNMLSPKEAQRILSEHQFPDYPRSRNDHLGYGRGPRWSSSPRNSREICLEIPQRNHDLDSPDENTRDDEQRNGAVKRQRSRQDMRSKNAFCDVHQGRKAWDGGRQKSHSDGHAHKKRQQMKDSQDDHRRYSTSSEDTITEGEVASEVSKQHSNGDVLCRLGANNIFSEVGNKTKVAKNPF